MTTYYVPYTVASQEPMYSEPAFCTGTSGYPIVFTDKESVLRFVKNAETFLGLKLEWGTGTEEEFPGIGSCRSFDLDPIVFSVKTSIFPQVNSVCR